MSKEAEQLKPGFRQRYSVVKYNLDRQDVKEAIYEYLNNKGYCPKSDASYQITTEGATVTSWFPEFSGSD